MSQSLSYTEAEELQLPSEACLTYTTGSEQGVWSTKECAAPEHLECTQGVRCNRRVNRCSSAFDTEGKCVFKWTSLTTSTTTCEMSAEMPMPYPCYTSFGPYPSCFGDGEPGWCIFRGELSHSSKQPHSIEQILESYCSSALSSFTRQSPDIQCSSTQSSYYTHDSPYFGDAPNSASTLSAKSFSTVYASSSSIFQQESYDSDASLSYLICSHNIEDFGVDVSYGREEHSDSDAVSSSSYKVIQDEVPDFSFIDDIYESVRAEINAEKNAATTAISSFDSPPTPVVTITLDQPVTVVGENGKEYKIVIQEVTQNNLKIDKQHSNNKKGYTAKRVKGVSLASLTSEEISNRKREQNRIAALRYRQKQRNAKSFEKEEEERLEKRNMFLRSEKIRLLDEIEDLKRLLLGRMIGSGNG